MYNIFKKHRRWRLVCAILSLSLLTVMAGAAVAPALGLIQEHFSNTDKGLVQMIVSMPALFIAGTNLLLFKPLCKRLLYVVFGCAAGLLDNIVLILICRALVGVGVGIIMPLLSAALYLAQFITPMLLSFVSGITGVNVYITAIGSSILLLIMSALCGNRRIDGGDKQECD